jgi:hypothetical protein
VSDYRLVQHDLQVNAWVMAYRRLVGEEIADWLGPEQGRLDVPTRYEDRRFKPMRLEHAQHEKYDYGSIRDLREETFAPIVPDATLLLELDEGQRRYELLIELDRTARPTKNVDKLRRYDALVTAWWRGSDRYRGAKEPPRVVFVCGDELQAESLMRVADHEVTGRHTKSGRPKREWLSPGRERMWFVAERDMHEESLRAWKLPAHPDSEDESRVLGVREVKLPGTPLYDPIPF